VGVNRLLFPFRVSRPARAEFAVSPRRPCPSCTSRALRSLTEADGTFSLVRPSLSDLRPLRAWPLRSSHPPRRGEACVSSLILPWASLCSKVLPGPCRLLRGILSWGFPPLQRMRHREATYTGLTTPGCAASSGFLSLLTPSSSRNPPALFHAGGAHGVRTFRGLFLPVRQVRISASLPLLAFLSTLGVATSRPSAALAELVDHRPESRRQS
jgi:hypothetical protein